MSAKWTEGQIHIAMRRCLAIRGWQLIAGEFPGGSDHELYPLNVINPMVACDNSPDPRRHSLGELIPDLVALRDRKLLIAEAKVRYNAADQSKLQLLVTERREHLLLALHTFAMERSIPLLLPVETLTIYPTLVFLTGGQPPPCSSGFSYLRIISDTEARFEGALQPDSV